jgi:hypothetical protein
MTRTTGFTLSGLGVTLIFKAYYLGKVIPQRLRNQLREPGHRYTMQSIALFRGHNKRQPVRVV